MLWQSLAGSVGEEDGTASNANERNEARINDISKVVIGCALIVANTLGSGFIEKFERTRSLTNFASAVLPRRNNMVSSSGMMVPSS